MITSWDGCYRKVEPETNNKSGIEFSQDAIFGRVHVLHSELGHESRLVDVAGALLKRTK